MMNRRRVLGTMSLSLLAAPVNAGAQQQARKVYRIGWLASARVPADIATFRERLRALGWPEGENVAIVERYAGANTEPFSTLATELAREQVDVIVTFGSARLPR